MGDWLIGGGQLPPSCSQAGKAPCLPRDGTLATLTDGAHIRAGENYGVPNGLSNQPTTARVTSLAQGVNPRRMQMELKLQV